MNAKFRLATKACLVIAACALLLTQVADLGAQDDGSPPRAASASAGSQIKQTSSISQGADSSPPLSLPQQQQTSDVLKALDREYRKNGRQMPSMNMDDLPNVQQPVPPRVPGSRNGPASTSTAPSRATIQPSKPNFFERLFHVGRARNKPAAPPQNAPVQQFQPAQSGQVHIAGRPAMPMTQPMRSPAAQPLARPAAPTYAAPSTAATPPATPTPTPAAQPQLREPAPIGAPVVTPDQPARRAVRPGARSGITQPLLDESEAKEDSESLELNQDERPAVASQPPQILPNQAANGSAESPYSGLRISPNEVEQTPMSAPAPVRGPENPLTTDDRALSAKEAKPASKPITDSEIDGDDDDDEDLDELAKPPAKTASSAAPDSAPIQPAAPAAVSVPAALSAGTSAPSGAPPQDKVPVTAAPAAARAAPLAPLAAPIAKKADDLGMKDDEDDDDDVDDDDKPLSIPVDEPAAQPHKLAPKDAEKQNNESEKKANPAPVKGLRGFCPVVLKDERKLLEARPHIRSEYRGKTYTFSTVEAKETFDDNPRKYVPAGDGDDVVRLTAGMPGIEGTLEHAAWYRGRLYLFSSADTRREFIGAPGKFAVND